MVNATQIIVDEVSYGESDEETLPELHEDEGREDKNKSIFVSAPAP